MVETIVKGAPGHFDTGEGVLEQLLALLDTLAIKQFHVVAGVTAWQKTAPYLPEEVLVKAQGNTTFLEGHCTLEVAEKIASEASEKQVDAIIGIGGGTVLDTAKAAAALTGVKVVLIPSIAATCAAWAPLSVFYDESGTFTHFTEFPEVNTLVLAEPAIIAEAPVRYLKAGIADTLAKYYEARTLLDAFYEGQTLPVRIRISQQAAELCKGVLLEDASGAIQAAEQGIVTDALKRVTEKIFMAGGMVGGFGGKAGRVAAAHSIHNGLTAAPGTRKHLHGELVAYGLLVQLAIEEDWQELDSLIEYYKTWGLPIRLSDLSVDVKDEALISQVVKKAVLPQESIHYMEQEITEASVREAIKRVESKTQHIETLEGELA
ncbi:iron-containing alcohol dehydrogenase [Planomicrobium sp. YIM 101495]|nr:iron-containing alcohol dehydrogenase family protein [Planomicrobium sp. YIM 101495]MTD30627.1 iron-containing alcohol dehydrogenase [Planomicrobium sp. YIM 101495]